MRYPALFTLNELNPETCGTMQQDADGFWKPARKLGYPSLFSRLRLAWGVFTGRYGALDWRE